MLHDLPCRDGRILIHVVLRVRVAHSCVPTPQRPARMSGHRHTYPAASRPSVRAVYARSEQDHMLVQGLAQQGIPDHLVSRAKTDFLR